MEKIRARFWIQHLRKWPKTVIHWCNSCKRFKAIKYFAPVPGQLLTDRTYGYRAFQTVGLDYAGPIFYKGKQKNLKKAYILLITCTLSRNKSIAKANLKWNELEEILLDIDNTLINKPLCYLEDDMTICKARNKNFLHCQLETFLLSKDLKVAEIIGPLAF